MSEYDKLAKFYDAVTGDQKQSSDDIRRLIKKYHPKALTLLDVACGTGSHLLNLSRHYQVSGMDISTEMLSIAYSKVQGVPLYQNDMRRFNFGENYDVIICMNDSINHLLKKSEWKKFFQRVYNHLGIPGLFIFNANTRNNLSRLSESPPAVHEFDNNYLITKVRRNKNNIYEWDLRLFEQIIENSYNLHESVLYQISFSATEIRNLLSGLFKKIAFFDSGQKRLNTKSQRMYCVAMKQL